ncbi:hypothetical protein EWM64_g4478 [Hericium alpestre]|uniref:ATP-dependent RNA helicase n=1 Tax=Hericium alpestre TaxID=135208 RepID=A0A4Z0A017_9AGAM|nr:hypothetical protein EWM64_g4478 [Hericium alpestre]
MLMVLQVPLSEETYSQQPEFRSLAGKVSDKTLKALTESPFKLKHMSSVQSEVLSLLPSLADPSADSQSSEKARDLLVKAKTGTGKTIAFLVPAIEARLKALEYAGAQAVRDAGLANDPVLVKKVQRKMAHNDVGALIISPTRELAMQIAAEAVRVAHHHDLEVRTLVGGLPMKKQLYEWRNGRVDIVVATPGRLRDALENHPSLSEGLRKSQTLILDEADTLLEMGFRPDLDAIVEQLPKTPQRQTFLFSATLSRPIRQIAQAYLDPSHKFIDVVPENDTPVHARIPQYHTVLPTAEHQIPHILRLIAHDQLTNTGRSKILLFLPTTKMTQLFNTLIPHAGLALIDVDAFRADKTGASILVSSDVSARGVDYPGVTRVIQVGVPSSPDQYVHRVGRTGRAGSEGRGDLVLLPFEANFVRWQLSGIPIKPLTVHQLTEDVDALVAKYDQDPSAFWTNVQPVQQPLRQYRDGRFAAPTGPVEFPADVQTRMAAMSTHIATLLEGLDVEAIRETLGSLLG